MILHLSPGFGSAAGIVATYTTPAGWHLDGESPPPSTYLPQLPCGQRTGRLATGERQGNFQVFNLFAPPKNSVRRLLAFFLGFFCCSLGRHSKFSLSTFSAVSSRSTPVSVSISSLSTPVWSSNVVCSTSFVFPLLHLALSYPPHVLTISVSLLLFSHLCLPHLPLILFLLSWSSQSSLFPSSISTFSSLFFLVSLALPFSVPRSYFHTLEQVSWRSYILLLWA